MIYPFSELLYPTLDFCASEHRLNNTRRYLHKSRGYIYSPRPVYTHFSSALCPLYAACIAKSLLSFEFARHFESHLARPTSFYIHMQTTRLLMNIPMLLCYAVHVLYSQPIFLTLNCHIPHTRGLQQLCCVSVPWPIGAMPLRISDIHFPISVFRSLTIALAIACI